MVNMNLEKMSSLWTVTVTVYPSQNGTSYSVRLQFEIDHFKQYTNLSDMSLKPPTFLLIEKSVRTEYSLFE